METKEELMAKTEVYEYLKQYNLNEDQLLMIEKWITEVGGHKIYLSKIEDNKLPPIEEQISNSPDQYIDMWWYSGYVHRNSWTGRWYRFQDQFDFEKLIFILFINFILSSALIIFCGIFAIIMGI